MKNLSKLLFPLLFVNIAYADQLAITFDDLPGHQYESAQQQKLINDRILQSLKNNRAPAIGFVNERELYKQGQTPERIAILKSWVNHGHALGNHTHSNDELNQATLNTFKQEVVNNASISKKLMREAGLQYGYFRHPYLHKATDPKTRYDFEQFLKQQHYTMVPVTIDTNDSEFNQQLLKNPHNRSKIIQQYLNHTRKKFVFYKNASEKLFNHNIKHVWLLHANLINSYVMNDLIKIAHDFKYDIIPLNEALKDPVYSQKDNYHAPLGVSWLQRWDATSSKMVDWSQDPEPTPNFYVKETKLNLVDKRRNRMVPVQLYMSSESEAKARAGVRQLPVVVLNHGYGVQYTQYSFLARNLAAQGYCVVSIQHNLKSDRPLPRVGNVVQARMPYWETGVQNILFSVSELKKIKPYLNLEKIALIGHCHGGDISMVFATQYPERVSKIVSLDSLRYPFPIQNNIPILSLKANDTKADPEVVSVSHPSIRVVNVNARHNDMYDAGSVKNKQEIVDHVSRFLN